MQPYGALYFFLADSVVIQLYLWEDWEAADTNSPGETSDALPVALVGHPALSSRKYVQFVLSPTAIHCRSSHQIHQKSSFNPPTIADQLHVHVLNQPKVKY